MCFFNKLTSNIAELKRRFKAEFDVPNKYKPQEFINGFTFPECPVITNSAPLLIRKYYWGLIPEWAKNKDIRQYTLNAKIETLHEKPSFKNVIQNRCLVISDGFYEWKWLDEKGKKKQKYLITKADEKPFAFAGLWSKHINKINRVETYTFTVVTTVANDFVSEIHNSHNRMPVILNEENELEWLNGLTVNEFKTPTLNLKAKEVV